jgi:hypothetical protein
MHNGCARRQKSAPGRPNKTSTQVSIDQHHVVPFSSHGDGQVRSDDALAHAAFAAPDGDDALGHPHAVLAVQEPCVAPRSVDPLGWCARPWVKRRRWVGEASQVVRTPTSAAIREWSMSLSVG